MGTAMTERNIQIKRKNERNSVAYGGFKLMLAEATQ